jgi:hypothetical protein
MEELKSWYFTLAHNQGGPGCVEVKAESYSVARRKMILARGVKWAFQYETLDKVHPLDRQIIEVIE